MGYGDHISATELDSHANMFALGKHSTIIQWSGLHAEVHGYSDALNSLKIPICDAALAYDDPYTHKTYILVARNVLHVPANDHNLMPPFLAREAGLVVNELPKRQAEHPTIEHHSILDPKSQLRIPLQLNGVFSYFPTRALTQDEIENWQDFDVIFLTPDAESWDPHDETFAEEEAGLLDDDGDIVLPDSKTPKELIAEVDALYAEAEPCSVAEFDEYVNRQLHISSLQMANTLSDDDADLINSDAIRSHLADVSTHFDELYLTDALSERAQLSKVAMAAGATHADNDACELFEAVATAICEAEAALGALQAGDTNGVSAEMLAKIWRIPIDQAERTLDVTTQLNRQDANSSLSRNFGTNDRMLRYRRIKSHFFTDTFYVTSKAKSTRGNICVQLFVSDKGFVAVYPMRETRQYSNALKMFAKDVGAPEVLVADPHPTQKKREVKDFCNKIGTKLRLLEGKTQWANRAELYVGLIKEGTRKDMREMHSPLVLWDYCIERRALIFNATAKDLFQLQGTTHYTATFGEEADISSNCHLQNCFYYDRIPIRKLFLLR